MIWQKEPAAISAAIMAILNVVALSGLWNPSADLLAGINTALTLVLGLFVRQSVTPTVNLPKA